MEFGKSAANFDSPPAESFPNGRRNAEPPKLHTLLPNCTHCRLNWPEKGVLTVALCVCDLQEMRQQARLWSPEVRQIDLDVNRTYRDHIMFRERYGIKQKELFHVLGE